MVKIVASAMMNLHIGYNEVMDTPFRPLTMILTTINEMMSPETEPIDIATDDSWAQRVIEQTQQEYNPGL